MRDSKVAGGSLQKTTGGPELDRKGQLGQDVEARHSRQDSHGGIAGTGQTGQDNLGRTAGTKVRH